MNLLQEVVDDTRVLKRNLVYIKGMPKFLAYQNLLIRPEFLGQYGNITEIFIKKEKPQKNKKDTYGVHVTYSTPAQASIAILCVNGFKVDDYKLKAAYGMTKFCQFFLKEKKCPRRKCTYVHYLAKPQDITSTLNKKINRQIRSVNELNTIKYILRHKFTYETSQVNLPIFPHISSGLKKINDFQNNNNSSKQHKIKLGRVFLMEDQVQNKSLLNKASQIQSQSISKPSQNQHSAQRNLRHDQQLVDICHQLNCMSNNLNCNQQTNYKGIEDQNNIQFNQPFQKAKNQENYYGSSTEDDSVYNRRFDQNQESNLFYQNLLKEQNVSQQNFDTFWGFPVDSSQK